jgi:histidinol dehydrogenase
MKTFLYPVRETGGDILARPESDSAGLERVCGEIFAEVRAGGDDAVRRLTRKFDGADVGVLRVSEGEFAAAAEAVDAELKEAIGLAAANIESFHRAQMPSRVEWMDGRGVRCWQEPRPVERVGLYVPGGTAPLFSTVLMLAVPARLAGCREVVLCTPPSPEGVVNPAILWAARLCGVDKVYKIGGVQAVAAMVFGTSSVPRVDKVFGPGNRYVMAAKQLAASWGVAMDMPAGPSEVMVVADGSAVASFVAADLLSQAEHGADSQVVLVTWTPEILPAVEAELERQLALLPRRDIARQALANSRAIVTRSRAEALDMTNAYAPEHLILSIGECAEFADGVVNAGSVFMGNYSPESAGDYASGTNHTLPTAGWARSFSGVNMDAFCKKITFQELSRDGLRRLAPAVVAMARGEGLAAHANAVAIRLENDEPE